MCAYFKNLGDLEKDGYRHRDAEENALWILGLGVNPVTRRSVSQ
jgi:hypothetical protein